MNKALIWLVAMLAVFIFLILLPGIIRKIDFNRQVKGKRPERQFKDEVKISYDKKINNPETEAIGSAGVANSFANWHSSNH